MSDFVFYQYVLIALIFVWSGFVRSGLGFGGAVLSLPFLLLVDNHPLVYLPLIAVQLLIFSSLTVWQNQRLHRRRYLQGGDSGDTIAGREGTVDWAYLKKALAIMIVPKLIGVMGLLTLPAGLMTGIIFGIVLIYSLSYIFNLPFKSHHPALDVIFLMLGGYVSGTSLIGAPLIIAVFATHVAKHKLRDTLFVLWFILVMIKLAAFVYVGMDLQLIHQLWLLPCAAIGHLVGLRFHHRVSEGDPKMFYRVLGAALLIVSVIGLASLLYK